VDFHDFRRWADTVRSIPLETVLVWWGADRDRCDKSQWRTDRGPLSVTGSQFFSWHHEVGGGGAIDLVMHLGGWPAGEAIGWLARQIGGDCVTEPWTRADAPRGLSNTSSVVSASPRCLRLPAAQRANFPRVRHYLTDQRRLAPQIVQTLIETGKLYADERGNAVFLMVAGKANRAIGAELRGTGVRAWRGLAPGSCKDAGYFWVGIASAAQQIILCESAIDAISCFQLEASRLCISTAGVRPDPGWLKPLIARGYAIACGFDDDRPGNETAGKMISLHPTIQRLRPPAHDWNDALADGK
jgi:hypothetical protein